MIGGMSDCSEPEPAPPRRIRLHRVTLPALTAAHAGLLLWAGAVAAPTVDERGHLVAGLSYYAFGRFDLYRVNPPLKKLIGAAPAARAGYEPDWSLWTDDPAARRVWPMGDGWLAANGDRGIRLVRLARAAMVPFALLGLGVCYLWGRDLWGSAGGLLAAAAWAFNPTVLTHGSLFTPDVPAAAMGLAAAYTFGRYLTAPTPGGALAAGALLGLANLTKMTWVVLFPLWIVAAAWGRRTGEPTNRRRLACGTAAVLAIGLWVLNGGYGFEGTGRRLGELPFVSRSLGGAETVTRDDGVGNRFAGTWLGRVPLPVPENWIRGIDVQRRDFETPRRSYLFGEWKEGGWWYYELAAVAVKEPVGWFVLAALAVWSRMRDPRPGPPPDAVPAIVLWLPPLVVCGLVSAQTNMSHHPRYLLPAYGFAFVAAGGAVRAWSGAASLGTFGRRTVRATFVAAVLGLLAPLATMPWPHAYFNLPAGGPANGWRRLHNSGLDWGQGLGGLAAWANAEGASFDGVALYRPPPAEVYGLPDAEPPEIPAPGLWALSAGRLAEPEFARWRPLRPDVVVGGNVYVYRIPAPSAASAPTSR